MSLLPQHSLLLDYLNPEKESRILILEGGDGTLAAEISPFVPEGEVLTLSRDVRDIWSARILLKDKKNASSRLSAYPESDGWDYVVLSIPKGRRYSRSLLVATWQSLKPNGKLILAGPTRKGAKAVIRDAERLFGNSSVLGYRHHQRAAICIRGDALPVPLPPEFRQPGIAPGTTHSFEVLSQQQKLIFETHPGIFSWEGVDEGSAFLLENIEIQEKDKVWDVGCGYGILGLAAATMGASTVLMTDINLIAVEFAQKNILKNHLTSIATAKLADGLDLSESSASPTGFDLILSNPAFHQGHYVDISMADNLFASAPGVLTTTGRIRIVCNRFLKLEGRMQEYFKNVHRIANNGKYLILEADNR